MNAKQTIAIILTSGLLLTGCTSDETIQVETLREVTATLNGFNQDESITRTAYNISETSGFQTIWATGDVLGIYPIGGDQVSFPISDGVGTTTAKFDGGSWALRGTYKYSAYYPFSKDCYTIDQTAIPVSLLGQVQTGSNTTSHLAAYDFMAAAGTQPSSNGSVDLQFNHVGCFLRMQFTMPKAGTYTSVNIETDGGSFTTKGTVNLAATTPALTATATSNKLTLGLNNVTTTAANQTIILYMMVAPDNLSTHTLTFTVEDSAGNTYTKTATGKNLIATYAYNYSLALETTGTGGSTGGGAWDNLAIGDIVTVQGHEGIYIGEINGKRICFATKNIGASTVTDFGYYYQWGALQVCNNSPSHGSYYSNTTGSLPEQYDIAYQEWGDKWRYPTSSEFYSIYSGLTYTTVNGVKGWKKTVGSNYLFLPEAGALYNCSSWGHSSNPDVSFYWTSQNEGAFASAFKANGSYKQFDIINKYYACSIRPVCELTDDYSPNNSSNNINNGHEYVDLGLPSGLKWATCNIGANTPEDYGDYFAWGETVGYSQDISDGHAFNWANYKWCNGSENTITKYCTNSDYGTVDNKTVLDLEDDAAHVNWGGSWRMPTKEELRELEYCTTKWEVRNGVYGYKVTGNNGNWIFLPAADCRYQTKFDNNQFGYYGYYWSSTLSTNKTGQDLIFTESYFQTNGNNRYLGLPIRPVIK